MRQILFHIPLDRPWPLGPLGEVQMFGFGLLLLLWSALGIWLLVSHIRQHGTQLPDNALFSVGRWLVVATVIVLAPRLGAWLRINGSPPFQEGLPIFGYGFMLFIAVASGGWMAARRAAREHLGRDEDSSRDKIWDLAFCLFLSGIAGARLFYLVEYRERVFKDVTSVREFVVAVFNLLPGLPLDGGFLVDSLVWRITGRRESGLIAAGWCGRVVTVLVVLALVGWPLLNGEPPDLFNLVWGLFIGGFLWVGATNAIRSGRGSRLLAGIRIDSVWRRAASLPARASAAEALVLRTSEPGGTAVVVEDDGRNAIGLLDDDALRAIPEQSRESVLVTSVMRQQPAGWVVEATPDQSIAAVVMVMQRLGIRAVPVRGPDGRIGGIVLVGDLEAALSRGPAPRT